MKDLAMYICTLNHAPNRILQTFRTGRWEDGSLSAELLDCLLNEDPPNKVQDSCVNEVSFHLVRLASVKERRLAEVKVQN